MSREILKPSAKNPGLSWDFDVFPPHFLCLKHFILPTFSFLAIDPFASTPVSAEQQAHLAMPVKIGTPLRKGW
jgi:hypothetical protein